MAAGNPTRRIGVLLTAAEWSILFEALRRFAMENEAAGRPDRARLTQRVLSKMTIDCWESSTWWANGDRTS